MYKIKLSNSELSKLKSKKKQEKDKKIYLRLQCIYLSHKGKSHKEIVENLGVNKNSVTEWIKTYIEKGIDELSRPIDYNRRISKVDDYIDKIKDDVKENAISTLAELQDFIKEKYSIEIEQSWLFRCCKKNSICLAKRLA
ncbi:MAG: helix-turn-helix domain-containing protein [Patescibacteria group bacterium]